MIGKDLKIKQLETEVESLKHDWLMCDEVCDQTFRKRKKIPTNNHGS